MLSLSGINLNKSSWVRRHADFCAAASNRPLRGLGDIALGVGIGDTDIMNDAIYCAGPKPTDTQVSPDFTSVLIRIIY
jgi:hypothetical protein